MRKSHSNRDETRCNPKRATRRSQARWLSYAAAGAATIAAASNANADVIINGGNLGNLPLSYPGNFDLTIDLDVNDDGINDIGLIHNWDQSWYANGGGQVLANGSVLGTEITNASGSVFNYAIRFTNLNSIGPNHTGDVTNHPSYYLRDDGGFTYSGWAADPSAGYLGIRFDISGNTHFGFVEIEIDDSANASGQPGNIPTILSYGYESTPDTAIGDSSPLLGDFDMDTEFTCTDIDLLYVEVSTGNNNPDFDLTSDELVDSADVDEWLVQAGAAKGFDGPIRPGDADLNGKVDPTDLNELALNWQTDVATSWCQADFNHDSSVNPADLNALALNWNSDITPAAASAPVPEPNTLGLMALGAAGLTLLRQQKRRSNRSDDDEETEED